MGICSTKETNDISPSLSLENECIQLSPISLINIAKLDITQFHSDDVRKIYREEALRCAVHVPSYPHDLRMSIRTLTLND